LSLLVLLSLAGCDDDNFEGPATVPTAALPLGKSDAHALTERFLSDTPEAALSAQHLAVLWLEPTGTHEGDTGTAEGVDHVPYFFDQQTHVILQMHDSAAQVQHVLLKHASGREVARYERGMEATVVPVQSGAYLLEVHHAHKGRAEAPAQRIFVRPDVETAEVAAMKNAFVRAPGEGVVTLTVSQDCPNCDFSNADLTDEDFSDVDLSGANFHLANLTRAKFLRATMVGAKLAASWDIAFGGVTLLEDTDFTDADLTGATFDGAAGDNTIFVNATLFDTTWGPGLFEGDGIIYGIFPTKLIRPNFSSARLSGMFDGIFILDGNFTGVIWNSVHMITSERTSGHRNFDMETPSPFQTSCWNCRFQFVGVNQFGNSTFVDVDLTRANFSGTDFHGVDLSHADLSTSTGVTSPETSFVGAVLSDGVAHGVNLSGQVFPEGSDHLRGQNLAYANLSGVQLVGANLQGANLSHATLSGINLSRANLEGADLSNALLHQATLDFASLRHAKMPGLQAGVAPGQSSEATSFKNAYMPSVDLTDADLRSADLSDAHIYGDATTGSSLLRTKLDSADLTGALLSGAAFSGSLTDAVFNHAVLVNSTFNGANLTNAKFDDTYLQGANFTGASSLTGASFINAAFSTATQCLAGNNKAVPPCEWQYTEQDGTPVIVGYAATVLGALATDSTVRCPHGEPGPCTAAKLVPQGAGPFPPKPACIPERPRYCNCIPVDQGGCAPQ
jgi:uncharacterized protein YjbI with pentapeptide repeats